MIAVGRSGGESTADLPRYFGHCSLVVGRSGLNMVHYGRWHESHIAAHEWLGLNSSAVE